MDLVLRRSHDASARDAAQVAGAIDERPPLAVGDRLDQVARPEGHVASGKDARAPRWRASPGRPANRTAAASVPARPRGVMNDRSACWPIARMMVSASIVLRRRTRRRRHGSEAAALVVSAADPASARLPETRPSRPVMRRAPRCGWKPNPSRLRLLELLVPLRGPQGRHFVVALERDDRSRRRAPPRAPRQRARSRVASDEAPRRTPLAEGPLRPERGSPGSSSLPTRSAMRAASNATKPPPITTTVLPRVDPVAAVHVEQVVDRLHDAVELDAGRSRCRGPSARPSPGRTPRSPSRRSSASPKLRRERRASYRSSDAEPHDLRRSPRANDRCAAAGTPGCRSASCRLAPPAASKTVTA